MSKTPMFQLMKYIHNSLTNKKQINKIFIIGNVSCDLDSFLSSYLLSLARSLASFKSNKHNLLHIPLINCKRGELMNRFDIDYVLKRCNINPFLFFYADDHFIQHNIRNSKIILVDHNKPDISQQYLTPLVTEVYDHHKDEHLFQSIKVNKTICTPLGSCSTMILNKFFLPQFPFGYIDPLMSLSAILIDTENFNPNLYKNKWINLDKNVFNRIMQQSFPNKSQLEYSQISDEYYNVIMNAKNDIQKNLRLGIKGVMIKDKKQYVWNHNKGGWSAFQITFNDLLTKYSIKDLIKEINQQCKDNGYQLYLVSYSDTINKKIVKTCVIYNYSLSNIQFHLLINYIQDSLGDKCYEKKELITNKVVQLHIHQSLTRKHCEPIIHKYFNSVKH